MLKSGVCLFKKSSKLEEIPNLWSFQKWIADDLNDFDLYIWICIYPRDPITETENGVMEPKYLAFRFGDCTPLTRWLDP